MSSPIPFPNIRARRPTVRGSDHLAEISAVPLQRSHALQTIAIAYVKLVALHAGDRDEARRLLLAELDVIDNPKIGECHE